MSFDINITRTYQRLLIVTVTLITIVLLGLSAIQNFVLGVVTTERVLVSRQLLSATMGFFPNSARLNARLAEAEMREAERDLAKADSLALRASQLSPWDYNYRALLVSIKEAEGDRAAAEEALRGAMSLAPNNVDLHYRLANLLLRQGKLAESLDEFRVAVSANRALLSGAQDLIWRVSGGSVEALEQITGDNAQARLSLSQFLLKQGRVTEAAKIFRSVDRAERKESPQTSAFLDALIAAGQVEMARYLWIDIVADSDAPSEFQREALWNGSFESDVAKDFAQFDWSINSNDYARASISAGHARTGKQSLEIDFLGRDTTRLDREISQLIFVRPGQSYVLEGYAQSDGLVTPEGPRLVVSDPKSSRLIARSEPVSADADGWQRLAVTFLAPQDSSSLLVTISRVPKYAYDDPTRGKVWFDDFALAQQRGDR